MSVFNDENPTIMKIYTQNPRLTQNISFTQNISLYWQALVYFSLLIYSGAVMAIEEPEYTLLEKDDNFELRHYEPKIIAEVSVQGSANQASNKGFRLLADYIFGNNTVNSNDTGSTKISMTAPVVLEPTIQPDQSQKISMTAPVVLESTQLADNNELAGENEQTWLVHFVMPKKFTLESLPKPNNSAVNIQYIPEQKYAVIRFSGLAGEDKVAKKTQALIAWLKTKNITPLGQPKLARYNPPWTLPFLRRNEVLVQYK